MRLPLPPRLLVWCCVAAGLAALGACSAPVTSDTAALVTVRATDDSASRCVIVRAQRDGGTEKLSNPLLLVRPDASVTVALVGRKGETARVEAQGYADDGCTSAIDEVATGAALVPGSLTLWLRRPGRDGGMSDDGGFDGGTDGGGGEVDGGTDAGGTDAGGTDAGGTDAGGTDAGGTDAGGTDAGGTDAGGTDAGGTDAGGTDAGRPDAGLDQDGDGSPFGVDCNDNDPQMRPGLTEVCFDRKDNNCNMNTDCADSQCAAGAACGVGNGNGATCSMGSNRVCVERDCANGIDDNSTRGADCADIDCNMQSCSDGLSCTSLDACMGGACSAPVTCAATDGGCLAVCADSTRTACVLTSATGTACSSNRCLTGSTCQMDGGCGGGTAVTCTPRVCADVACDPSTGCTYTPHPRYRACTGGSCDGDGGCIIDGFTTPPSNFDESTLPFAALEPSPGVGGSCNAVLSTSGPKLVALTSSGCDSRFWTAMDASVVVPQLSNGAEVMVLPLVGTFKVENNATLRFIGTRPVAFIIRGDLELDGTITVAADGPDAGAGAANCTVGRGRSMTDGGDPGSGGGGFGSDGGWGTTNGSISTPGGAIEGNSTLVPLRGGCAGGDVIQGSTVTRAGQGGGALQISVSKAMAIDGPLNAGGGGGRRGAGGDVPGSGGGSGGGILLEASSVTLATNGSIYANGGGGGQGRSSGGGGSAQDGSNGGLSTTQAAGGDDTSHEGDYGGLGAARNAGAGNGRNSATNGGGVGGGGGGGVGRIRINATTCSGTGTSTVSPQADSATSSCRY